MKKVNTLILLIIISISFIFSQNSQDKKISNFRIFPVIGQISPVGENLRSSYNPGYVIGIGVDIPKTFHFFKKDWGLSTTIKYSALDHLSNDYNSFKILTVMPHISTTFDQIIFNLGIGLATINEVGSNASRHKHEFIAGSLDIGYNIFSKEDFNIILNIYFLEILGAPDSYRIKGTSELYGVNLEFSKGL